jgi:hypothetical protein
VATCVAPRFLSSHTLPVSGDYYWDARTGPDIKGNILGVDIEITPSVSFELGQENNNTLMRLCLDLDS